MSVSPSAPERQESTHLAEAAADATGAAFNKLTHPSHAGTTPALREAEASEHKRYKYIKLSNNGASQLEHVPFGKVAGCSPSGVPAYSNGSDTHFSNVTSLWSSRPDGPKDFCTGFDWQCVEYGRRWLLQHRGILLPDIQIAAHIIYMHSMLHVPTMQPIGVVPVLNGTFTRPVAGSLIIYPQSNENFVGHVGVITEVSDTFVRVADQNRFFHDWGSDTFSAEYVLERDAIGRFWIRDDVCEPAGWVTFPQKPDEKDAAADGNLYAGVCAPLAADKHDTWLHDLSVPAELKGGKSLGGWTYLGFWGRSLGAFKGKVLFGTTLARILFYVSWLSVKAKLKRGDKPTEKAETNSCADKAQSGHMLPLNPVEEPSK